MENKILKFIPEDFEGEYRSNSDCPIARATKRELGYTSPSIGGLSVGDKDGDFYQYTLGDFYLNGERSSSFNEESVLFVRNVIENNNFESAYVELQPY